MLGSGNPGPTPFCATSEPPRTSGRCTKPTPRGDASNFAPSPIERTLNANVSRRHTSRGVAELLPASTNLRHKASTGAEQYAAIPSAEQQSEPINSARIETACGDCEDGLAVELVRSAIETLPRAPNRCRGLGGAAF